MVLWGLSEYLLSGYVSARGNYWWIADGTMSQTCRLVAP